jgi:hypothetical protein
VIFAVQLFLPSLIEGLLKGTLVSALDADNVEVAVKKEPSFMMLLGEFDEADISLLGLKDGKVKFESFNVKLTGVNVDAKDIWLNKKLSVDSIKKAELTAAFSEAGLASIVEKSVQGISGAKVRLTPDGATVTGEFKLGGLLKTQVEIDGEIVALGDEIIFRTGQFNIAQGALGKFGGNLAADIVLVDLNKMPINVTVKNIILKDGSVEIYADSAN